MREATTIPSTHRQPVHPERPSALDLILQRKAPVQMSNGVVAMGIGANWSHHSKPEAAIPLKHQYRLRRPLAMGLQKRHAELLSHFRPLRPLTKPAQQRVHLGKRNERGPLGIRDQDQTVQPLHLLEQLFNRGKHGGERKRQGAQSLIFSLFSTTSGRFVARDTLKHSQAQALRSSAPICWATKGR